MDKQTVLEQIREEAFRDELEKVALNDKTLMSAATKALSKNSINSQMRALTELSFGLEGMGPLKNRAGARKEIQQLLARRKTNKHISNLMHNPTKIMY